MSGVLEVTVLGCGSSGGVRRATSSTSAAARRALTPGRSRPSGVSHTSMRPSPYARAGIHTPASSPAVVPLNPRGATPTIVYAWPSTYASPPRTRGPPLNCVRHVPYPSTISGRSSRVKKPPSAGRILSTVK